MSDPITILGISSLSAVLALIVMGSLARNGIPGTREWFWANGALALGMLLSLDSHAPLFFSILGANLFLCLGAVLQLAGLRRFFRRHSRQRLKAASVLIAILAFAYFCFVDNNFAARVVVFSVFHAIYAFALGTTVLMNRPADRPAYGYVFTIGIGYAAATINMVRGIAYLGGWVPAQGPYLATPLHVLFLAIGTMAAPALTIGMVMMAHDRMSAALERHANIDFLTDLFGRRAFIEAASKECLRAQRFGRPLAIAMLDIDFFKQINDRYGHAGGDDMLAHFAHILTRNVRANDICGRIGGEEFAILLPETSATVAVDLLDRIRERLAVSPCSIGSRLAPCTFSAGVAPLVAGETLEMLMERADRALYQAKQSGRNQTMRNWPVDEPLMSAPIALEAANDTLNEAADGSGKETPGVA